MKKFQLATLAATLCFVFTAHSSIEIYNQNGHKITLKGRVKVANLLGDRNNSVDGEGDKSKARLGFDGQTKITDSISGYGRAEWEIKTSSSTVETRYAFAGISINSLGDIDYGRNDGVLKAVTAYTDVLPEFGGNAADKDRYLLTKRNDAVLTYRNSNLIEGLRLAIQYADNSNETKMGQAKGKEAYGINFDYRIADSGVSLAGGFSRTAQTNPFKTYIAAIKYEFDQLYLAALYVSSKQHQNNQDIKYAGYEFVAQYMVDTPVGKVTPSLAYIHHQDKSTHVINSNSAKYIEAGVTYDLNPNIKLTADYKINLLDENDIGAKGKSSNTHNVLALGLLYQF